jgi:hypothetical protein
MAAEVGPCRHTLKTEFSKNTPKVFLNKNLNILFDKPLKESIFPEIFVGLLPGIVQ